MWNTVRRSLVAAAAAVTLTAGPVLAGPPWISVEYPSNPHHPSTRGALFLIHAYHHDTSIEAPLVGTAEGLVDGHRRSLPLGISPTTRPGVYAVRGDVPTDGAWVLVLTLTQSPTSTATALVRLDREGEVAAVEVPSRRTADGWVVPRELQPGDVEAAIEEAARIAALDASSTQGGGFAFARMTAVPLMLLVAALLRRRRP